ncbi:MAG: hypothetical protein WCK21_06530 [Actinomycetota bacterium]
MVPHFDVSLWMPQQFLNPPGYANLPANVAAMKRAASGSLGAHQQVASGQGPDVMKGKALPPRETVELAMSRALLFAGSPDTVRKQISEFSASMGGIGHMLMLSHAGYVTFEQHANNLRLFGKEVLPALRELPEIEAAPSDLDDTQLLRNSIP